MHKKNVVLELKKLNKEQEKMKKYNRIRSRRNISYFLDFKIL